MHAIVQHADKLYEDRKWHEALEYLEQYGETEELDLLWRLMRINYRVGKHITPDRKAAERMAARGMELSERALKISDKHFLCQKVRTAVSLAGQTLTRGDIWPARLHRSLQAELVQESGSRDQVYSRICNVRESALPTYPRITQWTAVVLSWYAELQGQKKRIEKSFEVRDHLLVS